MATDPAGQVNRSERPHLRPRLTIVDVVALGLGASIGQSIFSVFAPAAGVAAAGLLVTLPIGAVPMTVFAVIYSFMGSAVPRSGASYDWPTEFVHPYLGFIVGWMRIVANTGALAVMTLVLSNYLNRVVHLQLLLLRACLLVVFFAVNYVGIRAAARLERYLVVVKVLAFGVFVGTGIPHIRTEYFTPLFPYHWYTPLVAVPIVVGLYQGIETATEVGEEIENSAAIIARGIGVSITLAIVVYSGVAAVSLGVLGPHALAASGAPILDAGNVFLGRLNTPLVLLAAVAAIGTSINAVFVTFSRFMFAMARNGALPSCLAVVHPRWGTPHAAVALAFLCGLVGLLLPTSLIFLFLAISIPVTLMYFSSCLSAWRLVERHPELHRKATFKLSSTAVKSWSAAGCVCAFMILSFGIKADARPYAVLAVWFAIGTAYWFAKARRGAGKELHP